MIDVDKKISEIEDFLAKSNQFVADVLQQLDENKRKMESMGWTEERFSKLNITDAERKRAIKLLSDMGHGEFFNEDLMDPPEKIIEPDEHIISVNRKMNRFRMI